MSTRIPTTFGQWVRNGFKLNPQPQPQPIRTTINWPKSVPLPGKYDAVCLDVGIKVSELTGTPFLLFKLRITNSLANSEPFPETVERILYGTVSAITFQRSPGLYEKLGIEFPPTPENLKQLVGQSYYVDVVRRYDSDRGVIATVELIERNP